MPPAKKQIAKTRNQLLNALEDHLSTLVPMLTGLQSGDAAHVKDIATKLRLLVCGSSGQQGFLWDLGDEVQANDTFEIRCAKVNTVNPITRKIAVFDSHRLVNAPGAHFAFQAVSLRDHITSHESVFVGGVSLTYRELIKEVAEQSGTAHETPGVSRAMAIANGFRIGDVHPYLPIIDRVARWALTFGETVIKQAVNQGYVRRRPAATPPPAINFESIPFDYPMDGPKIEGIDEGTVIGSFSTASFARAKELHTPGRFPSVTCGKVIFSFQATRRGRLRLSATGLAIPNYGYEGVAKGNADGLVIVFVSWQGFNVRVFINGEQVSGIP